MADLVCLGDFIGVGEERVARYLRDELPKAWLVVANIQVTLPSGVPREVDFLVLGTNRLFVIDEKSYRGKIHGNEHYWILSSGESCLSPIARMEMTARQVAGVIRRHVPDLRDRWFVEPLVVLSQENAQLLAQGPSVDRGLRLRDCPQRLMGLDASAATTSIQQWASQIRKSLHLFPPRPAVPRRIGSFTVTESLPPGRHYRQYLAEHDAGGPRPLRRLKVYQLDGLGEEERKRQQHLIYRDYHALGRLEGTGLTTRVDAPFPWQDEQLVVVPHHMPELASLRAVAAGSDPMLAVDRRFELVEALLSGLQGIHAEDVLHRNLSLDCVHVRTSNSRLRVVFSDFDFARIPDQFTIAGMADEILADNPCHAPEVRLGLGSATRASDVYSAGVMIAELLTGKPAVGLVSDDASVALDREVLTALGLSPGEASEMEVLIAMMTAPDERSRLKSADEALMLLSDLTGQISARRRSAATKVEQDGVERALVVDEAPSELSLAAEPPSENVRSSDNRTEASHVSEGESAKATLRISLAYLATAAPRPMPLLVLADTSESMRGTKVRELNDALRTMLSSLRSATGQRSSIQFSLVTFGGVASISVPLCAIEDAVIPELRTSGSTPMGDALRLTRELLENESVVNRRAYIPTVVLITDGMPTDVPDDLGAKIRQGCASYEDFLAWPALKAFHASGRAARSMRFAVGVGEDVKLEMLRAFINTPGTPVFRGQDAAVISKFLQFVTGSVTMRSVAIDPNQPCIPLPSEFKNDQVGQ